MRVMVFVMATPESESGGPPDPKLFEDMAKYNQELIDAGVMLSGEGLLPSAAGKRVTFTAKNKVTATDGPFAESKEWVGGFWIWQVKSMDDALAWLKKAPFESGTLEIRPIAEHEDYDDAIPEAVKEHENAMRKQLEKKG
jgi:hypothetical protein